MKVLIGQKEELRVRWERDRQYYAKPAPCGDPPVCPRCGKRMGEMQSDNALGRYTDADVCAACGIDEALRDCEGNVLPVWKWHIFAGWKLEEQKDPELAALVPVCSFPQVFEEERRPLPINSLGVPMSELTYARAYHNGWQWNVTWEDCQIRPDDPALSAEINAFFDGLLELPEFQTIHTMERFCHGFAVPDTDGVRHHMYSETTHFYIRLILFPAKGDNNIYCEYFYKVRPSTSNDGEGGKANQ